jgi:hypothetical protein
MLPLIVVHGLPYQVYQSWTWPVHSEVTDLETWCCSNTLDLHSRHTPFEHRSSYMPTWFSLVPPREYRHNVLKYTTTASFHSLPSSHLVGSADRQPASPYKAAFLSKNTEPGLYYNLYLFLADNPRELSVLVTVSCPVIPICPSLDKLIGWLFQRSVQTRRRIDVARYGWGSVWYNGVCPMCHWPRVHQHVQSSSSWGHRHTQP